MRKFLWSFVAVMIYIPLSAQVKIGLRMAPQMTWGTSDNKNTQSNGSRINVAYGLMVDYYFSDNYALGTEFCINSYGVNLNLSKDKFSTVTFTDPQRATATNSDDAKYNYKIQYFNIPLLLRMRTKEIGNMRYYAEFGFGTGFLFKSKADITFSNQEIDNVNVNSPDAADEYHYHPNDFSDDVSLFRASVIIGAGIQYNLQGGSALVVGLRYDNGLTSFTADDAWSTSLNAVGLNLGLLF